MNLVLFATAANLEGIGAFVRETAVRQKSPVNGCLCVMYDQAITPEKIGALVEPITGVFATLVSSPTNINNLLTVQGQVSALFARFYLSVYTRYPGAWLVVDDQALPTKDDFIQLLDRQHQSYGASVTGRAVLGDGSAVPVGPITIGVPAKDLKFLSYATNESWRQRGQYYFGRLNFGQIPPEEYLFKVTHRPAVKTPATLPAPVAVSAPVPKAVKSDTDLHFVSPSTSHRQISTDIPLDKEFLSQGIGESFAPVNVALTHPPKTTTSPAAAYTAADFPDKKALLKEVERVTGTKPHHFTGEAKLLEMLNTAPIQ